MRGGETTDSRPPGSNGTRALEGVKQGRFPDYGVTPQHLV